MRGLRCRDPGEDRPRFGSGAQAFDPQRVRGTRGQSIAWISEGDVDERRSGTGTCIVVFDTEEHAVSAIVSLTPGGGPQVLSSSIKEVEVEV
jgi:hypothetical protein